MTDDSNKAVVRKFFELLGQGRAEQALEHLSADAQWWVAGSLPVSGVKTKAEYLATVARLRLAFPQGLSFTVNGLTAGDGRVAAEVSSDGLAATGRRYQNQYHFLFVFSGDGKIARVKEYMDTLHWKETFAPGAPAA